MSSEDSTSEIVRAASERAKRVLSDSAREAQRVLDEAHREAVRLLADDREQAAELSLGEQRQAGESREHAIQSEPNPPDQRQQGLEEHDRTTDDLLLRQQTAAQSLVEAQVEVASALDEAVELVSKDILLRAQRQAAVILLEARMRVEGSRGETSARQNEPPPAR